MIREIVEGQVKWFDDLGLSDLPHPLPPGIRLHARGNQLGIEAQGLAGALPLASGDTLRIVPKIGKVNFLRLLFRAQGHQQELSREYEDFVTLSIEDEANIDWIVSRQLLIAADEVMRRSALFGRVRRRQAGVFAGGQLDVTATALASAQRKRKPAVFEVRVRTVDIAENRVITEALRRCWSLITAEDRTRFAGTYDKWAARFPRSRDISHDLDKIEQRFAAHVYGGSRDYYRRALMLAQVVLGSSGLGFSEAAAVHGDAILLNTSDVFEKYVRQCVSEGHAAAGYVVTKGTRRASLYLNGSYGLEPDIVVEKSGSIVLIADAKYKEVSESDHYQMNAYLSVFGVDRGLLLSVGLGKDVEVTEYRTAGGKMVKAIDLPMTDLGATEAFLATVAAFS